MQKLSAVQWGLLDYHRAFIYTATEDGKPYGLAYSWRVC